MSKGKKKVSNKISITSVVKSVVNKAFPKLDEKIIASIIALLFTIAILGITSILAYSYLTTHNIQDIDAIKTVWAVLGTPYGMVLGYYFKS